MERELDRDSHSHHRGGDSSGDDAATDAATLRMQSYLAAARRVLDGMNVEQMEETIQQHAQRGAQ